MKTLIQHKLEYEFNKYLKSVYENKIEGDTYRELKRAFYYGLSEMFYGILKNISKLAPEERLVFISAISNELKRFAKNPY